MRYKSSTKEEFTVQEMSAQADFNDEQELQLGRLNKVLINELN